MSEFPSQPQSHSQPGQPAQPVQPGASPDPSPDAAWLASFDAYLAGDLDAAGVAAVEAALKSNAAMRAEFSRQASLDGALRALCGAEAREGERAFVEGVMASLQVTGERSLAKSVLTEILEEREKVKRPFPWADLVKAAAVAAVAVAATIVGLRSVEVEDEQVVEQREQLEASLLLARVGSSRDAVWGDRHRLERDGDWLGSGLFHLQSGVVEITFDNGASTVIEGPALLDLESPERIFLRRGRLTAEVPPPAVGFVVNTPQMNVVDLGTRFGVSVSAEGDTELHVMEGLVEASRARGHSVPMQVREGLSVRTDSRSQGSLQPIEYGGDQFLLTLGKKRVGTGGSVIYRFDEQTGPYLVDSGENLEGGPYDASLLPENGNEATPRRTPGRIGDGLVFRSGESVVTSVPNALTGESPHTFSFWLKLPPKAKLGADSAIVSFGAPEDEAVWTLRWNADGAEGPVGALRTEYGDGFIVGTTDLRDGRWHHVVSRFAGGKEADVATHVRLYVDGRLEALGGYRSQEILPTVNRTSRTVLCLGRAGELADASFEGWIDEFALHADPLDAVAIYEQAALEDAPLHSGAE